VKRIYRITNRHGEKVCERGSKRACIDLLRKHVTSPPTFTGWSEAPYYVLRVETTCVRVFKAVPTKGPAR
jgi:hypothetical protein